MEKLKELKEKAKADDRFAIRGEGASFSILMQDISLFTRFSAQFGW